MPSSKKSTPTSPAKKISPSRKTVRRSSGRNKKTSLSPSTPFSHNEDYDLLAHPLVIPPKNEVQQEEQDAVTPQPLGIEESYFNLRTNESTPPEYRPASQTLLPLSRPPSSHRLWLWVAVLIFFIPILFFWGCAMKDQLGILTTTSNQGLLDKTKESWNNAFASDEATSTTSSLSSDTNLITSTVSTTTSIFPLQPLDLVRLEANSTFDPYGIVSNEGVLTDISKNTWDRIDSPSRVLQISSSTFGIAWSESNQGKPYIGYAALLRGEVEPFHSGPFSVIKKIILPTPFTPSDDEGIKIKNMAYADIFGTGNKVWLITYSLTESPRPALGSKSHDYILLLSPENLNVLWNYETYQASQALVENTCSVDLYTYPHTTGTTRDIVSARTCYNERTCLDMDPVPSDVDCTPHRTFEMYTWNPSKKLVERVPLASPLLQQIEKLIPTSTLEVHSTSSVSPTYLK